MEKNNFTLKAAAGTILALLLAVGIFLVVDAAAPVRKWGPPPPDSLDPMQNVPLLQIGLSSAMILLSLYLLFTYLKDYLQLKSGFTLGVIFAVFSLMLFAISANPVLHVFLGVYGSRGLFTLVPYLFATLSLAILVWVSSK